jgi:hypothetical protein
VDHDYVRRVDRVGQLIAKLPWAEAKQIRSKGETQWVLEQVFEN